MVVGLQGCVYLISTLVRTTYSTGWDMSRVLHPLYPLRYLDSVTPCPEFTPIQNDGHSLAA
jgi:hypothetical protein